MAHPARLLLLAWLCAASLGVAIAQEHPCVRPQEPFVVALCSDPELRTLADGQSAAMMAVWGRLSPDEQRRFRSEQVTWRETTARTCGVASSPLPLPLPVAVKDCLKRAEATHTEFLRRYTLGAGSTAAPSSPGRPVPLLSTQSSPPIAASPTTAPVVAGPPRVQASPPSAAGAPSTETGKPGSGDSSLGTGVLVVGTLALIAAVWKKLAKAADRRRRIKWTCEYINGVNQSRYFPAVPVGINLQAGEVGLLQVRAQLSEMRSHRYSTGSSVRLAKGISVSSRRYHSYRTRDIVDHGTVAITTRRVAYTGSGKTAQVMYRDLVAIEGDLDTNVVHTARRQNAILIHYPAAMLGLILVRFFASAQLTDNRLPDGWQFTAQPGGDGVTIDLVEGTQSAIAG
jgi:hypothetical protein